MPAALLDVPDGPPIGLVVALHGFTRSPRHLEHLAQACTRSRLSCLRPALAPALDPMRIARPGALAREAQGLASQIRAQPLPDGRLVVILGHSAGAAAACWIARQWLLDGIDPGLAGLVLVDGVDGITHLIERSLVDLQAVPLVALTADPGPCNRHGALERLLGQRRPQAVVPMPGSCHGDIEGVERAIYRLACADSSDDAGRSRVIDAAVSVARGMISGSLGPLGR